MSSGRSVCSLCRSFLLREQPSHPHLPPPPKLAHTTREILQLSQLARSITADTREDVTGEDSSRACEVDHSERLDHTQTRSARPLSKEDLRLLPRCRYPGQIVHIQHPATEAKYARKIRELLRSEVLGFDIECSWTTNRPCLVQLASRELCILWQVNRRAQFPALLHAILSSPQFLKVGHGSLGDARVLLHFNAVNTVNVFDTHDFLLSLHGDLRPPFLNLQGLVGVFLGQWLSKTLVRSKWSQSRLSWKQLLYASTDVWASLEVYLALMKYAEDIDVAVPLAIECALRQCKPQHMQPLEQALKRNAAKAERARLSLEQLLQDGGSSSSSLTAPNKPHSHTAALVECTLKVVS